MKIFTQTSNLNDSGTVYELDEAPEHVRRLWYGGILKDKELERAINPKNGKDWLLKIRAETILDNPRIWRLFLKLERASDPNKWKIENYFTDFPYNIVRRYLNKEDKKSCKKVTTGLIFNSDANGVIFKSKFGPISTMGHTLKYFSMFSTLALGDYDFDVPGDVRTAALIIAVRTMLNTEAPDFELDPRGIIPAKLQKIITTPFYFQSTFLAAHEFSHYLLGHLKDNDVVRKEIVHHKFQDTTDYRKYIAYNTRQTHEFDADIEALNRPNYPEYFYSKLFTHTLRWFAALSISEAVEDSIFPPNPHNSSHPSAKARYINILEKARLPKYFDKKLYCEGLPNMIETTSKTMIEDVAVNIERYEQYGSVYLAEPNTQWRGRELIDRVDY